ncbi:MAG: nickel-dependent hydrogenase large subunit, partial [Actinobacteria bacterium]|nr:nickel-dependent hydrogenase large subunit [Actinomycetota bacterium]
LNADKQDKITRLLDSADGPIGVLETYSHRLLSKKRDYLKTFGRIETHFLCLKQGEGLDLYDGPVELMMASGERKTIRPAEILEVVTEREVDYSYVRHPYLTALGPESGQFRVGPLARLQNATWDSPSLREFRHTFGNSLVQATMGYHLARIPEIYECIRQMRVILDSGLDDEVKNVARPRAGIGVGVVEAPRGILLHQYETDSKGTIRHARVIAPTTFHQGSIERSTLEAARSILNGKGGECSIDHKVEIEQVIRAYDPCMSCAGATQLRVIKRQSSGESHA